MQPLEFVVWSSWDEGVGVNNGMNWSEANTSLPLKLTHLCGSLVTAAELPRSSASRAGAEVELAGTPHPTPRTCSSPHEDLRENTLPRIKQVGEARIATLSKPSTNIVH